MRTMNRRTSVITIITLVTLVSVCRVNSAMAAKETFTRTKPHVNVGTIGGDEAVLWFHANAGVFDDGDAVGIVQVRVPGGESFLYRVVEGDATVDEETVVELFLTLERVGDGGEPTGQTDLIMVIPDPAIQGRLIYDILGVQVHVEAEGILGFRHEHTRPESLP